MAAPPDRRRARHEATRAQIVAAAWVLARERGLTGWALRDVATAVGMRAPSLYGYVASKHDLYDAMFAEGYRALLDSAAGLPADGTPRERARRAAHLFVAFCVADPARYQLLFHRTVPGFTPSAPSYALAQDVLAAARGLLADAGATDDAALDLWSALLTGLAGQQLANDPGGRRWTDLVDDAVTLVLDRAGPSGAARVRDGHPARLR